MKRKTGYFLSRSKNSLVMAIEIFNRPRDEGRVEGVLLFLDHAFEMLLKAIIFEKTGALKKRGEKYNYGFEKCVNLCSSYTLLDNDESIMLLNLNGFRDAAVHDLVIISEGLLYSHAESCVLIYGKLLKAVFKEELAKVIPLRILPLSTSLPSDMQTLFSSDLEGVRSLLCGRQRKEDEATARLRPYQIIEHNLTSLYTEKARLPSTKTLLKRIKNEDWRVVLPMVSGLVKPSREGIALNLQVVKTGGIPVRIDPNAPTAIAFRYVKPEDKYQYLTIELAEALGINMNFLVKLVQMFKMKENPDYHTKIKTGRKTYVQRYNDRAYQVLKNAIQHDGKDALMTSIRRGQVKSPRDYFPST